MTKNQQTDSCKTLPPLAIIVSVYHVMILLGCSYVIVDTLASKLANLPSDIKIENPMYLCLAFICGLLGGALAASRHVVLAVRKGDYQFHGGVLALVGILVIFGGLVIIVRNTSSIESGANVFYFVGGISFVIGFSSETFVKALLRASKALFGEDS